MNRAVKILSGVLAVLAIALCVGILLTVIGWPVGEPRMQELLLKIRRFPTVFLTLAVAFVIGAIGVFLLYELFAEHFTRKTAATIERNALGETGISFSALEHLVNSVVQKHADVRSSKTKITAIGDSVKITVRAVTSPTTSLLAMTHALQDEIAARIQAICGISVGKVDITIDQTEEPDTRSRI